VRWDWVHLVRWPLIGLLYQLWMIYECGAFGGMRIGRGNRTTRRKPAPVPLCPLQIPHGLTWDRTRDAAVGSRRLTAWAVARPECGTWFHNFRDAHREIVLEESAKENVWNRGRTKGASRLVTEPRNVTGSRSYLDGTPYLGRVTSTRIDSVT
jgi:hypothetical protein